MTHRSVQTIGYSLTHHHSLLICYLLLNTHLYRDFLRMTHRSVQTIGYSLTHHHSLLICYLLLNTHLHTCFL